VTNVVLGTHSGNGSSGYSGYSGKSGYSGYGASGASGYSGYGSSGYSGYSGKSALNGPQVTVDPNGTSFSISPGNYSINGQIFYFSGISNYDVSYFVANTPANQWYVRLDTASPLPNTSNSWYADTNAPTSTQYLIAMLYFPTNPHAIGGILTAVDYRAAYARSANGSSGYSGYSGYGSSGYSGYSGISGFSGANPGASGYSGKSGYSGVSGFSGGMGLSGFSGASAIGTGFSSVGGWGQICISDGNGGWTTPGVVFNYSNSPDNKIVIGDGTYYDMLEVNCYSVYFNNGLQTAGIFCTGNLGFNNMPTSYVDGNTVWCDTENGNVLKLG
jgi:hypothetical protein